MKRIFVLVAAIILLSSSNLLAEEEKATETKSKLMIVQEEVDPDGVEKTLNQVLNSQGLQFTLGGVRPAESGSSSYPSLGDNVILITPEKME